MFVPLSAPLTAWHLPMISAPSTIQRSAVAELEVEFSSGGEWVAVVTWADVSLWGGVVIDTAGRWLAHAGLQPASNSTVGDCSSSNRDGMLCGAHWTMLPLHQPAVCWLDGAVPVKGGEIHPLLACHNSVRCVARSAVQQPAVAPRTVPPTCMHACMCTTLHCGALTTHAHSAHTSR